MTQQPFTSTGVQAKTTELYALSAGDLATQVNLINTDFSSWISDNFTLSTAQQTYLDNMSTQFLNYAATLTAFAVANKLDIGFSFSGEPTGFKLVHLSNDLMVTNSSTDTFSVTGGITYEIEYTS